jgi:hypothetical protein
MPRIGVDSSTNGANPSTEFGGVGLQPFGLGHDPDPRCSVDAVMPWSVEIAA